MQVKGTNYLILVGADIKEEDEVRFNAVDAPRGSLVIYATAPGSVSADGSGRNGIFTGALLKHIGESGTGKGTLFIKTDPLGAKVIVNGEDKGESPVLLYNITLYTPLTLEAEKGNMYAKKEVSLKKIELTEVALSLDVLKGSLFIKTKERDFSVYYRWQEPGENRCGAF